MDRKKTDFVVQMIGSIVIFCDFVVIWGSQMETFNCSVNPKLDKKSRLSFMIREHIENREII